MAIVIWSGFVELRVERAVRIDALAQDRDRRVQVLLGD
jgi:hypothetical protein